MATASHVEWLRARFREELVLMEQRQAALLAELKAFEESESDSPDVPTPVLAVEFQVAALLKEAEAQPEKPKSEKSEAEKQSEQKEAKPQAETPKDAARPSLERASVSDVGVAFQNLWEGTWQKLLLKGSNTVLRAIRKARAPANLQETQQSGLDWGYKLGYEGYLAPASEIWPGVPAVLQAVEILFGTLFCLECILKGLGFFREFWNWFDLCLVLLWIFDTVLVKLVRAVQGFDSLIVMTTALKDSVNALFWVAMIMLVVEMMFALLLNQVLMGMVFDSGSHYTPEEQELLFKYFGTFPRAMLTMFQFTLGTWAEVGRLLQETVSPNFNIFTILHKVIVGFACIGVINGVFMQETMRVAQSDDIIMMRDVARQEKLHAQKMRAFFRYADHSKDAHITREEWLKVLQGGHAQNWFAAQGLKVEEADAVFSLLDQDNSQGSAKTWNQQWYVHTFYLRSLDLVMLKESHEKLLNLTQSVLARLEASFNRASASHIILSHRSPGLGMEWLEQRLAEQRRSLEQQHEQMLADWKALDQATACASTTKSEGLNETQSEAVSLPLEVRSLPRKLGPRPSRSLPLGMALEVQHKGMDWGYRLKYPGYDLSSEDFWPRMPVLLEAAEVLFGCLFCLEVVLKAIGLGRSYIHSFWNWFDLALVLLWIFEISVEFMPLESPSLRLLRLMRLLRLVKPLRTIKNFDSLIIMTTALKHSLGALFWAAVILLVVEMMLALLLSQLLMNYLAEESSDFREEVQVKFFEYFGTFPRAMLTMFQMTLGTWVPVARALQELLGPAFNIVTILHKVVVGFAVVGVINGVFMQAAEELRTSSCSETMKVAQSDDIIMMRDVARREKIHAEKMRSFFRYTDHSRDTPITRAEWERVMERQDAQHWFGAQGLVVRDPEAAALVAEKVFNLIDTDKSESISMSELVCGVSLLKGPASSLDLAILKERQDHLQSLVETMQSNSESTRFTVLWAIFIPLFRCLFPSMVFMDCKDHIGWRTFPFPPVVSGPPKIKNFGLLPKSEDN
ncbi:unnamed protein product [Effrenium voratum]|nr:unnamed protein product [Effrenium voratum]